MRLINAMPLLSFILVIFILYYSLSLSANPKDYVAKLSELKLPLVEENETLKTLDLSKFRGKYVVLHLFASWCKMCKHDTDLIRQISEETKAPIIGIAMRDNLNKVRLLDKAELAYNYITIDSEKEVTRLLNNKAVPETIIINPQGIVVFDYLGTLPESEVEEVIIPAMLEN